MYDLKVENYISFEYTHPGIKVKLNKIKYWFCNISSKEASAFSSLLFLQTRSHNPPQKFLLLAFPFLCDFLLTHSQFISAHL
jgi:hypothetical protein